MTKQDYKEIVYNAFRQTNSRANHILYMRTFRFGVMRNMNPVEQEVFLNTINEMIQEGLVSYEGKESGLDFLRLTEAGFEELYDCRPDYDIAESLMDLFRKNKYNVDQIIPMRNINLQFLPNLNPKEQDRFEIVANTLIDAGFIYYEDGKEKPIAGFILKEQGFQYIYYNTPDIRSLF